MTESLGVLLGLYMVWFVGFKALGLRGCIRGWGPRRVELRLR